MLKLLVSLGLLGVGPCALSAMPSLKKHPLEVKFYHRNFAHRGLFDNRSRCENSLSAFRAAVEHGEAIGLGTTHYELVTVGFCFHAKGSPGWGSLFVICILFE